MENQPIQNPIPEPVQSVNQTPAKTNNLLVVILSILLLVAILIVGFFVLQTQKLTKQLAQYQSATPSPSPTATADETASQTPTGDLANWKTYTNTAGYSIKYPTLFTTQILAAGAGNKEAGPIARSLFIYKPNASEPYIERYINLEVFQIKPTYNQQVITQTTLDNRTVEKIAIPDAKFDIYSAQVGNEEFVEIYVSKDPTKEEVANQILSTFHFLK